MIALLFILAVIALMGVHAEFDYRRRQNRKERG